MRNPIRMLEEWLQRTVGSREQLQEVRSALAQANERLERCEAAQLSIQRALYIGEDAELAALETLRHGKVPFDPHLGR